MESNPPAVNEILTINQAADYLGVSRATIWTWRANHGLPHYIVGQTVRIRRDELDRWLSEHYAQPVPQKIAA